MKKSNISLPVMTSIAIAITAALSPSLGLAEGFSLEEVVVTARKREESLQDVPVAVSSFGAEELAAYNMSETKDLAAFTPGLFIEINAASNLSSAKTTIRGQVQSDTLGTTDPSVGWYIDDIYLARTTGTIASLFDLERIEVLKGPQGTLYGRNTTGGAIKLITTKANTSDGFSGFANAAIGSFGANKIDGAINIPLIEDKLAVRISALSDQVDDGFGSVLVTPTAVAGLYPNNPFISFTPHRRDAGQKDVELFRVNALWDATDDLSVSLSYEQSDSYFNALLLNTIDPNGFTLGGLAPQPLADIYDGGVVNALQESWAEHELLSLTVEYDISENLSTKLVYGYRDLETSFISDVDGSALPLNYFLEPFEQNSEQTSIEWQLSGVAFDGQVDWIGGLFVFEEEGIDFSNSNGAGSIPNGILAGTYNGTIDKNKSRSAFFSTTWHMTDQLNLTVGARRTKDEKPVSVNSEITTFAGNLCRFDVATAPNGDLATCTWSAEEEYSYTSWNIGIDYQLNDDVLLYAKSSRAFRAGGQNLRAFGLATVDLVGNPIGPFDTFEAFEPEEVTDIELGVKGQFFDNRLQINTAIFTMDYKNAQKSLLLPTPNGLTTFITNTSGATFKGIEIEGQWIVTDNFKLVGTFGKINWDYENPADYAQAVPKEEYTLRANYLVPIGDSELLLDLNYSHRGEFLPNSSASRQTIEADNGAIVEEVNLVGGRITFNHDSSGVSVAVWGSNLTDEEYTLSPLVLSTAANLYSMAVGTPRAYGLDLTYNF